jgi:hypothetical protein
MFFRQIQSVSNARVALINRAIECVSVAADPRLWLFWAHSVYKVLSEIAVASFETV